MIIHYTGIQVRITGNGELKSRLISMDNLREFVLQPITITNNGRELFKLANLSEQKAQLELSTTSFGEFMNVRKVIIFFKPVFTQYPG